MQQQRATQDIAEIRERMAASQTFRGFASVSVLLSALMALVGAAVQPAWIEAPGHAPHTYVGYWSVVAVIAAAAACFGVWGRTRRAGTAIARTRAWVALGQIGPSLLVGALTSYCVLVRVPEAGWMLPGLWSLLFALAVLATRPSLPREVSWVGAYYLLGGAVCLTHGHGDEAYAAWQMALTFGVGQLLGAAVLHWRVERTP